MVGATVTAGNVSASEDLTLRALSGGVTTTSFKTGRDLIVQGSSLSTWLVDQLQFPGIFSITSLGNFHVEHGRSSAGRNLILDVTGKATLGATTAANTIRIVAGDLDLTGALTAPNAQIESKGGAMQVGGTGGAGFVLDNNDFGQLRVSGVTRIYAGSTSRTARGDLTLQDLAINTANTPNVSFLVGSGNDALVQGMVAPTTSGGIIRIGDAADLSWRPRSILVTGALGCSDLLGRRHGLHQRPGLQRGAAGGAAGHPVRLAPLHHPDPGHPDQRHRHRRRPARWARRPIGGEVSKVFVSTGRHGSRSPPSGKAVSRTPRRWAAAARRAFLPPGAFNPALIIDPPRIVELWGAIAGAGRPALSTGSAAGSGVTFTVVDDQRPADQPAGRRDLSVQRLRRRHQQLPRHRGCAPRRPAAGPGPT